MTMGQNNLPVRRIFYFAVEAEKKKFLELVKLNVRSQVREELLKLVQEDEFIDLIIERLKTRLQKKGGNFLSQLWILNFDIN